MYLTSSSIACIYGELKVIKILINVFANLVNINFSHLPTNLIVLECHLRILGNSIDKV